MLSRPPTPRLLLSSAALLVLLGAGCSPSTNGEDARAPRDARNNQADQQAGPTAAAAGTNVSKGFGPRDDLGRTVDLKAPAQRVIVVGPGAAETIFALGAGSRLVGRDSGADFPAAVKEVAVVADFNGPNIEACVAARPDLVLLQGETWGRERVEKWQRDIGAPVAALMPTDVAKVQANADKIAAWLGVPARDFGLKNAPAPQNAARPSAFIEIGRSPLWTSGRGTLVSDVVARGGFRNVAGDVAGYKAFSKEALLARAPDFYIATGKPENKAKIVAELHADPALGALEAVRRGQVLVIPGDNILRPGPRLKDGLAALQKAAHG